MDFGFERGEGGGPGRRGGEEWDCGGGFVDRPEGEFSGLTGAVGPHAAEYGADGANLGEFGVMSRGGELDVEVVLKELLVRESFDHGKGIGHGGVNDLGRALGGQDGPADLDGSALDGKLVDADKNESLGSQ